MRRSRMQSYRVRDLIKELKKYDPYMPICIFDHQEKIYRDAEGSFHMEEDYFVINVGDKHENMKVSGLKGAKIDNCIEKGFKLERRLCYGTIRVKKHEKK